MWGQLGVNSESGRAVIEGAPNPFLPSIFAWLSSTWHERRWVLEITSHLLNQGLLLWKETLLYGFGGWGEKKSVAAAKIVCYRSGDVYASSLQLMSQETP